MGTIRSGIGLSTGINTTEIVEALISIQRAPILRMQQRILGFQSVESGLKTLEARVLSIITSIQQLGLASTYDKFNLTNSDSDQIQATVDSDAIEGIYQFQALRTSSTNSVLSKGYANSDQQTVGSGTLTIATGGQLNNATLLDLFNSGAGVRRGTIRITDRSGTSADVDLSNAYTVDDVLDTINANTAISVTASTDGGRIVLSDNTGSTTANLSVVELNGGDTAKDLGILKSVSADTLDGDDAYQITGDFLLSQINDGNGVRLFKGAPDIRITLTDDTQIEVNLDDSTSITDVLNKINTHVDNGGKLTASLSNGRITLTDTSGGGGTSAFLIEDINDASVVRQLGLDAAATGTTINGRRLAAGINSVLLSNLRGGQGIDQLGQISLTNRAGITATIDLSTAESLDEVLGAINSATSTGGTDLQLNARINDAGTGIVVEDNSGSTLGNLIIADVATGTLATQLGISVDAAQNSIDSGSLNLRYKNAASSIASYAPDGGGIEVGSIQITDTAGNTTTVSFSSAVTTIGDVLQRLNAATGVSVSAALNESGDGFVLIDEAGGAGVLKVEEIGGTTASDLKLLGDAVLGSDGKYRVESRSAAVIDVEAGDTLDDIVTKINAAAGFVTASIFDDGSSLNAKHLLLTSTTSGDAGRLVVDTQGLGLGLNDLSKGEDALLRIGSNAASGFLVASETNVFQNAAPGIDITVKTPGTAPATVTVSRDIANIESKIDSFVKGYNSFIKTSADLTRFDLDANIRGVLQGKGIVLRVQSRLDRIVNRNLLGPDKTIRSLSDLGIRVSTGGKLVFNKDIFNDALKKDSQAVFDFFLEEETGFADIAEKTIESLTDPFTGSFVLETNALQASVRSITDRIDTLNALLETRKDRLFRQFANMESIVASLTLQQNAIATIAAISL